MVKNRLLKTTVNKEGITIAKDDYVKLLDYSISLRKEVHGLRIDRLDVKRSECVITSILRGALCLLFDEITVLVLGFGGWSIWSMYGIKVANEEKIKVDKQFEKDIKWLEQMNDK